MCQPSTQINVVPYEEAFQVLNNVTNVINGADGKFQDPNIDLSIPPSVDDVIEIGSTSTTTQSTVIFHN